MLAPIEPQMSVSSLMFPGTVLVLKELLSPLVSMVLPKGLMGLELLRAVLAPRGQCFHFLSGFDALPVFALRACIDTAGAFLTVE